MWTADCKRHMYRYVLSYMNYNQIPWTSEEAVNQVAKEIMKIHSVDVNQPLSLAVPGLANYLFKK